MTLWFVAQSLRRAPHRLALGALGVAFPVAIFAATMFFLNIAVSSMTRVSLEPVQIEQRALATSLKVDMANVGRKLGAVPGVSEVDQFAAADVVVRASGAPGGVSARLFAVDSSYIEHNPWVRVVDGSVDQGALLGQTLRASPGFESAKRVTIELPGVARKWSLTVPVSGTVDLRGALPTWFGIPTGEVQGDVAVVPRALVVDYVTFRRDILPTIKKELGTATPVLNKGLTDLPPVSLETHVGVDHGAYPSDPGAAATWSGQLRRLLERQAFGDIVVADDAFERLTEAGQDANNAKTLFILLGIPGGLVAAALGLALQSALSESHRREDALLRLRGATDRQLTWLAAAEAAAAWLVGSALGLLVSLLAVGAVTGQPAWEDIPAGGLVLSVLLAVGLGALATSVRLVRLVRASGKPEIVERQLLERGWQPLWRRAGLDFVAIAVGIAILAIDVATGGLNANPIEAAQASRLALHFYVLLAPLFLWVGITLLAIRILLARSERWTHPERTHSLPSWRRAALRWMGRRPARTGVAVVLGILAVSFGTEVVAFVDTYRSAKQAEDEAAFASDLRLTPGDPATELPQLGSEIAATSAVRSVPARAEEDRKSIMALDMSSYSDAVTSEPQMISGQGVSGIVADPQGVLIAEEIATDFEVHPGDSIPLTLLPDDPDRSRNLEFNVTGVFRSVPPTNPPAEIVMNAAGLPPYLADPPEFYLARVAGETPPGAVAGELRDGVLKDTFAVATIGDQKRAEPRSLAALDLGPLSDIQAIGAALIAAVGVAVLGAFMVLERRREFALLQTLGADAAQVRTGPAQEGAIAVLASIAIGVPIGLGLALLAARVLGFFFTLKPPALSVPIGTLAGLLALMVVASAIAIGLALVAINRMGPAKLLREP